MTNLNVVESFRTKEELVNYFKEKGQSITEAEIDALRKSYEQTELKDGALTMQQLDDVAGGLHLEFRILTSTEEYERLCKQNLKGSASSFYTCVVRDKRSLPLITAIAYFDHKEEVSFNDYTNGKTETAYGLTPEVFFIEYAHLAPLAIEAVSMSIREINSFHFPGCETDLKFFRSIIEVSHKFPEIRHIFNQIKQSNIASKTSDGLSLLPSSYPSSLIPSFNPTDPITLSATTSFTNVLLRVPTYLLPEIYNLAAKLEREHPGSTSISFIPEPHMYLTPGEPASGKFHPYPSHH